MRLYSFFNFHFFCRGIIIIVVGIHACPFVFMSAIKNPSFLRLGCAFRALFLWFCYGFFVCAYPRYTTGLLLFCCWQLECWLLIRECLCVRPIAMGYSFLKIHITWSLYYTQHTQACQAVVIFLLVYDFFIRVDCFGWGVFCCISSIFFSSTFLISSLFAGVNSVFAGV